MSKSLASTLAKQTQAHIGSSLTTKGQGTAYDSNPNIIQQLDKKVFVITSYTMHIISNVVNWMNEHKLKYKLNHIQDTNNIIITFKNKADASFFKLSMEEGDDE